MRLPVGVKQVLVPIWNGAHRVAWTAGEYLGAVAFGRFDRCWCCGRFGPKLYRPRAIPRRLRELWGLSPRLARSVARKETLDCAYCGAKLRARRLARVLVASFPTSGPLPRSAREWASRPEARALRIAEINRIEGLHEAIAPLPLLRFSDFGDPATSGVPSEDLSRLSYENESLDVVLTSETLEHVPDLDAAFREIRRVLRPGGLHLFTVPLLPGVARTFARREIGPDGLAVDRHPPISHPGGDWGYPVFTEFGADLPEILARRGFATEVHFGPASEDDVSQVFESRKV